MGEIDPTSQPQMVGHGGLFFMVALMVIDQ